jgi:DNA-binding response OmpR family regulator
MPRQILVCDNEPHILRAISLKLARAGFDIKNVTNVETCWRLLQRDDSPALLITDRNFPSGPDGMELVRRIRDDARLSSLPVIVLFANESELAREHEATVELKVALAIPKPFSPRELVEAVGQLVGQSTAVMATV